MWAEVNGPLSLCITVILLRFVLAKPRLLFERPNPVSESFDQIPFPNATHIAYFTWKYIPLRKLFKDALTPVSL